MLKATDIQPGDTVFHLVRAEPLQGLPGYIRHVRVLANEPGTVVHTPGTVRVRFLSGTDTVTGQTVRWTLPGSYWQNGLRPEPPEFEEEAVPEELDSSDPGAVRRMLSGSLR